MNLQLRFSPSAVRSWNSRGEPLPQPEALPLMATLADRVLPIDLVGWLLESQLHVRLQLQLHKYTWHPDARGV